MDDKINIDIDKKHQELIKMANSYSENLENFKEKINVFYSNLKSITEKYQIKNLNSPFDALNDILIEFSYQLKALIETMENTVILILKQNIENIKNYIQQSSVIYNNLKESMSHEKEIINKNNSYEIKLNKGNKNKPNDLENDLNSFNNALIESNKQLYEYEKDYARELVEDNKKEYNYFYNDFKTTINETQTSANVIMFANQIKKFSEHLDDLYKKIYIKFEQEKDDNKNILMDEISILNSKKKEKIIDINLNFDENKEKEIEKNITMIIQELIKRENPLKIKEVINIFNFLGININCKKRKNCINMFLSKISELSEQNTIYVKNYKNFIHLANIMNTILLQDKSNANNSYQIVLLSSQIKFKNRFLYEYIRRKNIYLKSDTFWKPIITNILFNKINKFLDNNVHEKTEESANDNKDIGNKVQDKDNKAQDKDNKVQDKDNKVQDKDNKVQDKEREKEKGNLKILLKNLNIDFYEISKNIKKLNYNKFMELIQIVKESVVITFSELIPLMLTFSISDIKKINLRIKKYIDIIGFDNSVNEYLDNLILIEQLKTQNFNYLTLKNEIIFSAVLKFLPKIEYIKIFLSNKDIYPTSRRDIFNTIFMQKDLSLDLHIKYLGLYLSINKTKKQINYNEIKNKINITFFEDNKNDQNIIKTRDLIKNDLNRTKFIQKNPNHREAIESLLFGFYFTFKDIKYYQGLNMVICYLYQFLNKDEEKTFYYFYSLIFNSKYHLLFEDNFGFLNILFSVFEKIIKIKIPEFLDIICSINIDINYFCSSWFITLFAGNITLIDMKDNPPFLEMYFLEKFCLYDWSAILNLCLTIIQFGYEKIKKLEKEELIKYIMDIITEENIFDNKNFEKCKNIYEKNEKWLTKFYIDKLIDITQFEYKNQYLIKSEEC